MDNLDLVCNEVVYDNNAQEVFKKLEDLDNQRDLFVSRWIWELLQNARGLADSQPELNVEIALDGDYLTFRHNGPPFAEAEIAHLIFHGSTKHNARDIGRFGSGFITTHLISRRVRVRGRLSDGRPFDFELNREGANATDLRVAMDQSKEELRLSLSKAPPPVVEPYTTEYIYPVPDESTRDVVEQAVTVLIASAAYIFAFNPMLSRLRITTAKVDIDIAQEPMEPLQPNTSRLALRTNGRESAQWLVATSNEDVTAAVLVEVTGTDAVVVLPSGVARLFLAFPLNGTETLCIPLVINSELFAPREDRDGIYLGVSKSDANQRNMELFTSGCQRILTLATLAAQQDWENAAALAYLQSSPTPKWVSESWLREQMRHVLVEGFRTEPLLRTVSGKLIPPKSGWIPEARGKVSSMDLWRATEPLLAAADLLPCLRDQTDWVKNLGSWASFAGTTEGQFAELWTVERLAERLENFGSIDSIPEALRENSYTFDWVNQVHTLICRADGFDLFRKKRLIPNERGEFTHINKLRKDQNIDPALKDIADLLNHDVRSQLIHNEIATPDVLSEISALSAEELLNQLLDLLRQRIRDTPITIQTQSANLRLFAWLLKKHQIARLDNYPALTQPDSSNNAGILYLRTAVTPSGRPLAPIAKWPESARPYADLLPGSAILHSQYAEIITEEALWQMLASHGFVHLSPLYETNAIVKDFLPDEPLSEDESMSDAESMARHPRTDIAFLTSSDHSIIDRARNSTTRSVGLIRFILNFVLNADANPFLVETAQCNNGAVHHYFRARWLTPLRKRAWVPIGDKKSKTPSAESFAVILTKEPDLLKTIGEERVSRFLSAIGVSPADLMLRTVGRDEPERVSLIQSLAVITSAAGDDPERVKALAGAIREDPAVLALVEARRNQREIVKRNQSLGELVERLFVEAFEGTDLTAKRTGPGHDFQLLQAAGEEEDAAQIEVRGPRGSVFVEIKATTTNGARMSVKQAGEAVANMHQYYLCVLQLEDSNPDVDTFKQKARFVLDIGAQIESLYTQYTAMKANIDQAPVTEGGFAIELSQQQVRFRIDESVWTAGAHFAEVLENLSHSLRSTY